MKVKLDPGAYMPERAHEVDAGLDLFSPVEQRLPAFDSITVNTGVHVEIPRGYAGFLKSKSGLNVNHDIIGEGVIDAGYTGPICVKLYNLDLEDHMFHRGDKLIQLVIVPVALPDVEITDHLEETERGDAGFGSTGR